MKVLMLGWEFPPFISGGLGTACYGLTHAMNDIGLHVLFVLPRPVEQPKSSHVRLLSSASIAGGGAGGEASERDTTTLRLRELEHVRFRTIDVAMQPYARPIEPWRVAEVSRQLQADAVHLREYIAAGAAAVGASDAAAHMPTPGFVGAAPSGPGAHYSGDLYGEAERYARLAAVIGLREQFDVVHAHDWMTFPAGIAAAAVSGRPLVVHVHSTEFDRSGEHVNRRIYNIERQGVHAASRVIAVSLLTKNILISRYGVAGDKIEVVYNAIENNGASHGAAVSAIRPDEKVVLFLGRITMQKGPEYFLQAARKVLSIMDNVRFVMAGSGDMIRKSIEMAAEMGIGHRVLFPGFLRGDDVTRIYKMADLYVMPSVSEPFGIAPLEALSNDVPAIISKQSGVSEVLTHVLKVDFWDIDEMANKIVAVLRHPPLHAMLRSEGGSEVRRLTWTDSARRCVDVYKTAGAKLN